VWSAAFVASGLTAFAALAQDMPRDDGGPFVDIDWSIALRGGYTDDSVTGKRYEAILAPEISLTRPNANGTTSLSTGAELSIDQTKAVRIDDLHASAASDFQLDQDTALKGSLDLSVTQASPFDSSASLPTDTTIAPREFTGTATGSAARKLGKFTLTGTLTGERFIEGPTTLNDSTIIDNTDQSFWLGTATLRTALDVTPHIAVFAEGNESYQKFDAASPTLLKFLDGRTLTLRGGVSYTQEGTLTAEASVGRAWLDYADPSLTDQPGWVYNASLSFTPSRTLTLNTALDTSIGPSADTLGDTDLGYTLIGSVNYVANPWLTLRGSASYDRTITLGNGDIDSGYSAGAGLDLAESKHIVWTADYLFSHRNPAVPPATDTHTITIGVTIKK
jgi:hypothetical protein